MEYNWLQALEMAANGQPMHVVDDTVYFKYKNNWICWYYKLNDEYFDKVVITKEFISEMYEPYHKQIELTEDEKVILRNVGEQFKWIARDNYSDLCLYCNKPTKSSRIWEDKEASDGGNNFEVLSPFNHLFHGIKWEDAEPRLIADLIKEK